MRTLKELDAIAAKIQDLPNRDLKPARRRREIDCLTWSIFEILNTSIRKQSARKGMLNFEDDVQQHSLIAITQAVETWDADKSSFSTYVHWKLMAEIRTLELHLFPERRALAKDLDIQKTSIDASNAYGEDILEFTNFNPEAEERVHANAENAILYSRMDEIFALMISDRVTQFEMGGYVNTRPLMNGMRDIHIFIMRELEEICANDVSVMYNLTRERIRQITTNIEAQFYATGAVEGGPDITDDQARQWKLAVSLYKEHSEVDIRLGDRSELLPSSQYEKSKPAFALPQIKFDDLQVCDDASLVDEAIGAPEIVEDLAFASAQQTELDLLAEEFSEPSSDQSRTFAKKARRAIYVSAPNKLFEANRAQNVLPFGRKAKMAAFAAAALAAVASQGAAAKSQSASPPAVEIEEAYAVKLDIHGSKKRIRDAAETERAKHAEFSDLKIAYVPGAIERENSLAFAPLAWLDAQRICSDMTAKGEKCSIIRFGRHQG